MTADADSTPATAAPPVCERCGKPFAEGEVAVAAGGSDGNVYYHQRCVKP